MTDRIAEIVVQIYNTICFALRTVDVNYVAPSIDEPIITALLVIGYITLALFIVKLTIGIVRWFYRI